VAKSEKNEAAKTGSAKSGAKASAAQEAPATSNVRLYIVGAAAVAALVAGIVYWRASSEGNTGSGGEKKDPDLAELMAPGPLEDISLGKADAPNTIVEYASMTCPHCAPFHKTVPPELQTKYFQHEQAALEAGIGLFAEQAGLAAQGQAVERAFLVGEFHLLQAAYCLPLAAAFQSAAVRLAFEFFFDLHCLTDLLHLQAGDGGGGVVVHLVDGDEVAVPVERLADVGDCSGLLGGLRCNAGEQFAIAAGGGEHTLE